MSSRVLILALLAALAGCQANGGAGTVTPSESAPSSAAAAAPADDPTQRVDPVAAARPSVLIEESWVTPEFLADEIDSVATYRNAAGEMLLFATAKQGHHLRVFDAATGAPRAVIGTEGDGPGQFRRPNGIYIVDRYVFVAERDAHRVQVLDAETHAPLGRFGDTVEAIGGGALASPYGLYVAREREGDYTVFVTDSYRQANGERPPDEALDARVHKYAVRIADGRLEARELAHFGAQGGPDSLHVVESIYGDPVRGRLLVAEEDARNGQVLKLYGFDGAPLGRHVGEGIYAYQPEGIALVQCDAPDAGGSARGDGLRGPNRTGTEGYFVVSDQHAEGQRYHVFERGSLAYRGSFRGPHVRMTDGLWFEPRAFGPFARGALFAQHDDRAVVAFDWVRIRAALQLPPDC